MLIYSDFLADYYHHKDEVLKPLNSLRPPPGTRQVALPSELYKIPRPDNI
jgi:hypothetical protein